MNSIGSSAPTLLEQLRTKTKAQHDALESSTLLKGLLEESLQLELYADILKRYFSLLIRFEEQVAGHPGWEFLNRDFESCLKSPILLQDLDYLGVEPEQRMHPVTSELRFDCSGVPEFMGTLYVIEGSSLGGRVISRKLEQHLGLTARAGAAYFNGYGDRTFSNWRDFCQQLELYGDSIDDPLPIVAAANHAFSTFKQAMSSE
ncbi:MAG: biliverdin-producing heme oxygenase [Opitutales bacterium]|nr:biliverdin-producing heme oxygenase [Opitutales bacterium]